MSLARNVAPPTQDEPASEPAQPQKVNDRVVYDLAGRRVHVSGEESQRWQAPGSMSRMLAAILSRGRLAALAVRRWRAPAGIPRNLLVVVSAIVFLALIGFVAYAFRRPASPLPPGALLLNRNVKQDVPFGPVTITPSAAVKPGSSTAATTPAAARPAVPKPSAARRRAKLRWHPRQDDSSAANLNQQSDIQ